MKRTVRALCASMAILSIEGWPASAEKLVCPIPSTTITAPPEVCPHSRNTASVPDAGATATYTWSIANGRIEAGQGTTTIEFTAGPPGSVTIGVTVSPRPGCSARGVVEPTVLSCPTSFYTVPQCRLVDTRRPDGPYGGPSLRWGDRTFLVSGPDSPCGIPATASAVALSVVTVLPTAPGYLLLFQQRNYWPDVSTINYSPGQIRAGNVIVSLSADGEIMAFNDPGLGSTATVDLILDVSGYFQ